MAALPPNYETSRGSNTHYRLFTSMLRPLFTRLVAFIMIAPLQFISGSCGEWIVPEILQHDNATVGSVAFMLCSSSIRIAVVEPDGTFTPDLIWPEYRFPIQEYGLYRGHVSSTRARGGKRRWSYRSAYIGHVDQEACRTHRHPFSAIGKYKNQLKPWLDNVGSFANCFIAGTIHAFWLAPDIYGMEFHLSHTTMVKSKELMVSVLSGLECEIPLESIDKKYVSYLRRNSTSPPCFYGAGNSPKTIGSVAASFHVKFSSETVFRPRAAPKAICVYDTLPGHWQYDLLSSLELTNMSMPHASWAPAYSQCKSIELSFRTRLLPSCKDHIGIIDDSNVGFLWHYGFRDLCHMPRTAICNSNAGTSSTLNFSRVNHACLDTLQAQRKDIIFFNLGAHIPEFAPHEVVDNLLQPIITKFQALYSEEDGCLVIFSVLDSLFEEIPTKFDHGIQVNWRNSWRTSMRNDVTRNWVASLHEPRIHYMDMFAQSLALHYDGHKDAVHFSIPDGYDGMSRLMYSAAIDLCGFPALPVS